MSIYPLNCGSIGSIITNQYMADMHFDKRFKFCRIAVQRRPSYLLLTTPTYDSEGRSET